jgi:PAS domain S-box-containing protein
VKANHPVAERSGELLAAASYGLYCRTDRIFGSLLVFQYIAGIVAAFWVSPRTWAGAESHPHIHVWAATVLGLIIIALPVTLVVRRPGIPLTRHAIAVAQALMGALFIHLSGGRIEAHFHIFGSLAFLAFYRDWRVLVTASTIIAADHLLLGIYWPRSIFGVASASSWRWLEHAAWVAFEDIFLIRSCVVGRREMAEVSNRHAALEALQARTEAKVIERTSELRVEHKQRRTAEEHSRHVLQSSLDPIIVIDARGTILSAGDATEAVFGWAPGDLIGQRSSVLVASVESQPHEGGAPCLFETHDAAILGQVQRLQGQRKDGAVIPIEVTASRVENTAKDLFVVILRDLSERIRLEKVLKAAHRLESIGHLAAGIAHEINTPTQYVSDNTRFLEDSFCEVTPLLKKAAELAESVIEFGPPSELADELKAGLEAADIGYLIEEIPRAIEQSLTGIDRVKQIVHSMKVFSHPGADGMASVDINESIDSTVTVASSEWRYVANLVTNFDLDLPRVLCLAGEINQVILNLIINAAHAIADVVGDGENGKGTISISTQQDGDFVEIRISDTGSGIPQDVQSKIYDPFFTTKGVGRGTGQGLSIAQSVVVNHHNGSLRFTTEPRKGTTFMIRLPIERQATAVQEA